MTHKGHPFLFDQNVFDPDDPRYTPADAKKPRLEYTQAHLNDAKTAAFESGKIAGFKESQASLTQDIQKIVQKIEQNMATLFAAEESRNTLFEAEAVNTTLSIFRKIFPVYAQTVGTDEVKKVIADALTAHKTANSLTVEVAPAVQEGLQDFIGQMSTNNGERIIIKANPTFNKQQCRILWTNGGITYDINQMTQKILGTLQESLAVYGITSHDNGKTADPPPSGETT